MLSEKTVERVVTDSCYTALYLYKRGFVLDCFVLATRVWNLVDRLPTNGGVCWGIMLELLPFAFADENNTNSLLFTYVDENNVNSLLFVGRAQK